MDHEVGIACGGCDTFSAVGIAQCPTCGNSLAGVIGGLNSRGAKPTTPLESPVRNPVAPPRAMPDHATLTEEERMEQARNYVCKSCATSVPSGHKFCGRCGAEVPPEIVELQVKYFGAMQTPGRARLVCIRGEAGTDGLTYLLQGTEHIAGRKDAQLPFGEDAWVSARHANFFYKNDKLFVRDEGSLNGVYLRIRQPARIEPGDLFIAGEQVFRIEATPKDTSGPDPDQTYFYSSPKRPSPFRVVQVLRGGASGLVFCARENIVHIGREDNDMNFPEDVFMSGKHAKVELAANGQYTITDVGSKNGTYARVKQEKELSHGDYVFLGHQLLRVEISA